MLNDRELRGLEVDEGHFLILAAHSGEGVLDWRESLVHGVVEDFLHRVVAWPKVRPGVGAV